MEEIKIEELDKHGITLKNHIMDNEEKRFRIINSDGSSYIRTEAPKADVWQNSHYHSTLKEMYIVQHGWIIFAEYINGTTVLKKYVDGEYFISKPNIPHNLFVSANSVLHTVKYGNVSTNDWIAFEKLDAKIKDLSAGDLLAIIN